MNKEKDKKHSTTHVDQMQDEDDVVLDLDELEDSEDKYRQPPGQINKNQIPVDNKQIPALWELSLIMALSYLVAIIPYFALPSYGVFGIITGVLHSIIISLAIYFVLRRFKYYYAQTYGYTFFSVSLVLFALRFVVRDYALSSTGFIEALLISIILVIRTDNSKLWRYLLLPWGLTEVIISVLSMQLAGVPFAVITTMVRGFIIGRSLSLVLSNEPKKLFGREKQVLNFDNFNIWNVILFILAAALIVLMKLASHSDLLF